MKGSCMLSFSNASYTWCNELKGIFTSVPFIQSLYLHDQKQEFVIFIITIINILFIQTRAVVLS